MSLAKDTIDISLKYSEMTKASPIHLSLDFLEDFS